MPLPFWGLNHFLRKVSLLAAKSVGKNEENKKGRRYHCATSLISIHEMIQGSYLFSLSFANFLPS